MKITPGSPTFRATSHRSSDLRPPRANPSHGHDENIPGQSRNGKWIRHGFCFAAIMAGFAPTLFSKELKPEEIHELVAPCVALIEDIDSHGGGVVISRDGLILTNQHVVASGISMSVTVDVKEGGKVVSKRFENVEVWKVHPKYDLALIKLDYDGGDFAVARRLPEGQLPRTGSSCYAIGHPGSGNVSLVKSITGGLVSAASRQIEGLDYIQTSAALNPGNSGGALADGQGRVIGISTWRLDQADNIGFAIPLGVVNLDDFVLPSKRPPDFEQGKKFEEEARRYADLYHRLEGEERVMAIHLAAYYYRQCLQMLPADPAPYHNLGTMYFRLKEDGIARKYLEATLKLNPNYPSALSTLGIILARSEEDLAGATELWFKGVAMVHDKAAASDCAENLAIGYFNQNDHARAAYCVKWSNILAAAEPQRNATRAGIWEQSVNHLSEQQFVALKSKTEDFSQEDLENFAAGRVAGRPTSPPQESKPAAPITVGAESVKHYFDVAQTILKAGVEIPVEGLEKPLPAEPSEVIMGYAGACLIMQFPELNRLGVFDLCQARITHYINLEEKDAVIAAGGKVLLIYYPVPNRIEMWDMTTWEKKKETTLRTELRFSSLGMGLLNHGFAVGVRPKGNSHQGERVALISIPDCVVTTPEFVKSSDGMALVHFFGHLGESAKVFVEQSGTSALVMNPGAGYLNLIDHQRVEVSYRHGISGSSDSGVVPGGGSYIIGGQDVYRVGAEEAGLFRENDKNDDSSLTRWQLAPVHGYRGVVEMVRNEREKTAMLRLRDLPLLNVSFSMPLDEALCSNLRSRHHVSFHASAFVQRCALVDRKGKKVIMLRMDQSADTVSTGPVAPGARFSRKLVLAEGTKATIDSGPEGLSYDPGKEMLFWDIPADQRRGTEVSVIFLLTDADGQESFHVEKIAIP